MAENRQITLRHILQSHDEAIRQRHKNLETLSEANETTLNNISVAVLTIQSLRNEITRLEAIINQTKQRHQGLKLETYKLHKERNELTSKCASVVMETEARIVSKADAMVKVKAETEKQRKLQAEMQEKNRLLRDKLKSKDERIVNLKAKLSLLSSWSVRTQFGQGRGGDS